MTLTNQALTAKIDATLRQQLAEHAKSSTVIETLDRLSIAAKTVYPFGYCADAGIELDAQLLTTPIKTLLELFKPLPLVAEFSSGAPYTVKPLEKVRDRDSLISSILPVFPAYLKSERSGTYLTWWTKLEASNLVTEMKLPLPQPLNLASLAPEHASLFSDSFNYSTGSSTFLRLGYKPVDYAALPLYDLECLPKIDSYILNAAWGWREAGVENTQAKLDEIKASAHMTKFGPAERRTEFLHMVDDFVERYLPLAQATDEALKKCEGLLRDLFSKGYVESDRRSTTHLIQYLKEQSGVGIESLELRNRSLGNEIKISVALGMASRSMFSPREFSVTAPLKSIKLQEIPVQFVEI